MTNGRMHTTGLGSQMTKAEHNTPYTEQTQTGHGKGGVKARREAESH